MTRNVAKKITILWRSLLTFLIDHMVDDQQTHIIYGEKSGPMTIFRIKVDSKTIIHSMAAIVCRT